MPWKKKRVFEDWRPQATAGRDVPIASLLGEIEEAWQKRLEVAEDDTILDSELKPEAGL